MPNIAILADRWSPRSHEVTRGIHDYVLSAVDWHVENFHTSDPQLARTLVSWGASAVVVYLDSHVEPDVVLGELHQTRLPVVAVCSSSRLRTTIPLAQVAVSRKSVASLLAQHLQSLPFERVALCVSDSDAELMSALNHEFPGKFEQLELRLSQSQLRSVHPLAPVELTRLLARPLPLVLLAHNEQIAVYLRRLVAGMKLAVPRDVSIISLVDSLDCALPGVSVTSVLPPDRECGYQAARLAHRLLSGVPVPSEPLLIDSMHLTCRASSVESGQDLAIVRAIKFIEENATRGITVADVMTFQQTSRVTFERQFLLAQGCTPGEYIRKIKVDKARQLLSETQQSIEAIGKACGYLSPAKFSSFFKRALGVSPATYRSRLPVSDSALNSIENLPKSPNS